MITNEIYTLEGVQAYLWGRDMNDYSLSVVNFCGICTIPLKMFKHPAEDYPVLEAFLKAMDE
jgi:hypothetical protein